MRLWSLADGSCLRTFEGHQASVLRLDFLSAGTQLLSAGADGLLKLWSVRLSGGLLPCIACAGLLAPLPVTLCDSCSTYLRALSAVPSLPACFCLSRLR